VVRWIKTENATDASIISARQLLGCRRAATRSKAKQRLTPSSCGGGVPRQPPLLGAASCT
jgi:hypothetical protein